MLRRGGDGMDAGQGVEFTQRKPWVDEYDPDCPTDERRQRLFQGPKNPHPFSAAIGGKS